MRTVPNKRFNPDSIYMMSPTTVNRQSWLNSSESQAPHSSISYAVSLNLDFSSHHLYKGKERRHQLQDQDSSSTQSTGQSYPQVPPPMEGSNPRKQSGYNGTGGKLVEGSMESVLSGMESYLSLGTPDFFSSDYHQTQNQSRTQTLACMPYSHPDPYFGRILAPWGPQPIIHPQMMGVARVPLPPHPTEEEPIYVNPKQYHGIIRRRVSRAKLEAQNKIVKERKPYLHESRHRHACKRERGSGGRFLNKKNAEQSQSQSESGTNGSSFQGEGSTMCDML